MLISALCFTGINSVVRFVDHLPVFEIVFFRAIGTVVCCLFIIQRNKIPILGNNKKLLVTRGVVGLISLALFYKALQLMPMGSAVSLRYLSPFFAAGFAIYFLKEKMLNLQWLFYLFAFVGVLLLKGFDSRISLTALVIILTSAVFSGLVYVVIRKIGDSEHPIVIVNYFLSISTIVAGVISIFNWVQPIGLEWLFLFAMGIFGFVAQYFMTRALQIEEANLITPFKYSEVIFTLLIGWSLFGEGQSAIALLAMLLIIASLLLNVWVKQKSRLKA